ncbi:Uu.00g108260.m01.CDS01 [Anthostomella pinea]|uniref:Uu.00g108260.m01.CDS01 n=1 Tax=Anthostomella pinea TaxID=933095 RepID=A0AAI8YG19_9PEZI|nr:Uu.00g108260.m01.CDS01 [Anthostomella pinea]
MSPGPATPISTHRKTLKTPVHPPQLVGLRRPVPTPRPAKAFMLLVVTLKSSCHHIDMPPHRHAQPANPEPWRQGRAESQVPPTAKVAGRGIGRRHRLTALGSPPGYVSQRQAKLAEDSSGLLAS